MATAFEPLKRFLENFLRTLSRTSERSERFRRVFRKPRCCKDESDGCIESWIEIMKQPFEEEDLTERQEFSAQRGRDSPKLRDGQKPIPAGHS